MKKNKFSTGTYVQDINAKTEPNTMVVIAFHNFEAFLLTNSGVSSDDDEIRNDTLAEINATVERRKFTKDELQEPFYGIISQNLMIITPESRLVESAKQEIVIFNKKQEKVIDRLELYSTRDQAEKTGAFIFKKFLKKNKQSARNYGYKVLNQPKKDFLID